MADVQKSHVASQTPSYFSKFGNTFLTAPSFLLSSPIERLSYVQRFHFSGLANGGGGRSGTPSARTPLAMKSIGGQSSTRRGSSIVLEAHPKYPLYLSGSDTGDISLHSFREEKTKKEFSVPLPAQLSDQKMGIASLQFYRDGYHFAGTNDAGLVTLWTLEADSPGKPYSSFISGQVGSSLGLQFLNSSSVVATAGKSLSGNAYQQLALWDTLLPPSHQQFASSRCFVSSARSGNISGSPTCLHYSSRYQMLIVASDKGSLVRYDLRQQCLLPSVDDTSVGSAITCIAPGANDQFVVTGTTSGDLYVWDLPTLELRKAIHRVHSSKRTVSISKWIDTQGVMDLKVTPTSTISCGVDGTVKVFSNI